MNRLYITIKVTDISSAIDRPTTSVRLNRHRIANITISRRLNLAIRKSELNTSVNVGMISGEDCIKVKEDDVEIIAKADTLNFQDDFAVTEAPAKQANINIKDKFLKLDQTTPQTIVGGIPIFDELKTKPLVSTNPDGQLTYADVANPLACELIVPPYPNPNYWQLTLKLNYNQFELASYGGYTNVLHIQDIYLKTALDKRQIIFNLPASVDEKAWVRIPFNCTITGWEMTADVSGSCKVDLWVDTFANYPPTDADTITASNEPELSAAQKGSDTTLTGWTVNLDEGSYIMANVDSVTTIEKIVLILTIVRR